MAKPVKKAKTKTAAKRAAASWTLYGVSKKTRDAVRRAAEKDGVNIGAWVDRTLRESAESRLKGGPANLALPPELLDTLSDLSERVKALTEKHSFGSQALQQMQHTASELGEQVTHTYDSVAKRADQAIDELRSWTDETMQDAAKWGTGMIDSLKNVAAGIERLQNLLPGASAKEAEKDAEPEGAEDKIAIKGAADIDPASQGPKPASKKPSSRK